LIPSFVPEERFSLRIMAKRREIVIITR